MSSRSGIVKAMSTKVAKLLDGTGDYINNLYGNVSNKVTHFDDITEFPYISITPGPEVRDDKPSNISWSTLTVYIRIYVENSDDAQGQLESIMTDMETFVDTNLQLEYLETSTSGTRTRNTLTNNIISISTDEGLLDPNALGEIAVNVQYEKTRRT